jgi:glutathione S-transferase
MLRVLGRVSSINVRKVLWTLDELGVDYERED